MRAGRRCLGSSVKGSGCGGGGGGGGADGTSLSFVLGLLEPAIQRLETELDPSAGRADLGEVGEPPGLWDRGLQKRGTEALFSLQG